MKHKPLIKEAKQIRRSFKGLMADMHIGLRAIVAVDDSTGITPKEDLRRARFSKGVSERRITPKEIAQGLIEASRQRGIWPMTRRPAYMPEPRI